MSERKDPIGKFFALVNGVLVGVIDATIGQPVGQAVIDVAKSNLRPGPRRRRDRSSRETPRATERAASAAS
jgi:hypothetical protein